MFVMPTPLVPIIFALIINDFGLFFHSFLLPIIDPRGFLEAEADAS